MQIQEWVFLRALRHKAYVKSVIWDSALQQTVSIVLHFSLHGLGIVAVAGNGDVTLWNYLCVYLFIFTC